MGTLESLAVDVRSCLAAPDDDHYDALLLAVLLRFFQAWDKERALTPTGAVPHPNRDS